MGMIDWLTTGKDPNLTTIRWLTAEQDPSDPTLGFDNAPANDGLVAHFTRKGESTLFLYESP